MFRFARRDARAESGTPRRHRWRRWRRAAGAVIVLSVAGVTAHAAQDPQPKPQPPPPRYGLAGGTRALWAYRLATASSSARPTLRFAVMDPASNKPRFRLLPVEPIVGTIRSTVVRGDTLHVFFSDGTHRSIQPAVLRTDAPADLVSLRIEVDLPSKQTPPLAIAGSASGDRLWAIVPRDVALGLKALNPASAPDDAATPDDGAEGPEAPTPPSTSTPPSPPPSPSSPPPPSPSPSPSPPLSPSSPPEPEPAPASFVLVWYDGLRWVSDRPAFDALTGTVEHAWLMVRGTDVVVVYRNDAPSAPWRFSRSPGPEDPWSDPKPVALPDGASVLAAAFVGDEPALLLAGGPAERRTLQVWVNGGSAWGPGVVLAGASEISTGPDGEILGAWSGSRAAVGVVGDDGQLRTALWSADDGTLAEPLAPVEAFAEVPYARLRMWISQVIEFGLLAIVFLVVFLRRHDSVLSAIPLGTGQLLAPLSARLAAFVIDAAIVGSLGAAVMFTFGIVPEAGDLQDMWAKTATMPDGTAWLVQLGVGLIYALYAGVFEAATGATPGKKVLGLRVVAAGGGRCAFRAIVLRNLLRVVDFQVPPVLILVGMTLNRQRLGDIVARTVVVCTVPLPPQAEDQTHAGAESDHARAKDETDASDPD